MTTRSLAPERRRYRKIYARLWINPDFQALSDSEKLVALYLLSGPQTNRIGLYKLSLGATADDLSARKDRISVKVATCVDKFRWEYDKPSSVLWIPSWWAFNPPGEKANNFKGALTDLNDVPPTPLLAKFCNNLVDIPAALHHLIKPWQNSDTVRDTDTDSDTDTVDNSVETRARPSQEQEQELEIKDRTATAPPPPPALPVEISERQKGKSAKQLAKEPNGNGNYRVIQNIAKNLLNERTFEDDGDVIDAVKAECGRLGIAYGPPHEEHDVVHRAVASARCLRVVSPRS